MALNDWLKRKTTPGGAARRLEVSDVTKARFAAGALWLLVALAGAGGVASVLAPGRSSMPAEDDGDEERLVVASEVVQAAGFAERFVTAYLAAASGDDAGLEAFLGYRPELPAGQAPAAATTVRVAAAEPIRESYWAVTTAAGEPGRERFWRVGVLRRPAGLIATGLPTPVGAPAVGAEPELAVSMSEVPPSGDPIGETVAGWVAAYACGRGDASRYLAPGVVLDPVTPPVCNEARLERWGASEPDARGRVTVVTNAVLGEGGSERTASFAVVLARRGDRWEVAELLGGPPLAGGSTPDGASAEGEAR